MGPGNTEELRECLWHAFFSHKMSLRGSGENLARLYTKNVRGARFASLLEPGAVKRAAGMIDSMLEKATLMKTPSAGATQAAQGAGEPHTLSEEPRCGICGCGHG